MFKECLSIIFLEVSDQELIRRLLERGKTSGRVDDNMESIQKRLITFHNQSTEVIDFYETKNKVIRINGERKIEDVRNDFIKEILQIWPDLQKNDSPSKCCHLL